MRSTRAISTFLCLLGLWLQMLAPAAALSMHRETIDPFAVICHGGPVGDAHHDGTPDRHGPACDHCLVCHATVGGLPADGRPPYVVFDYPVGSPLRWSATSRPTPAIETGGHAQPRGPPRTI